MHMHMGSLSVEVCSTASQVSYFPKLRLQQLEILAVTLNTILFSEATELYNAKKANMAGFTPESGCSARCHCLGIVSWQQDKDLYRKEAQ